MPAHRPPSKLFVERRAALRKPALTSREAKFVDEYLSHPRLDVEEAASWAGFKYNEVYGLINNKAVRAAIETAKRYRANAHHAQQDYILSRWRQVIRADPRELVEHWRVPCRFCWGLDHRYQYTDLELQIAVARHLAEQQKLPEPQRVPFDDQGGGGYTINRDPCRGKDVIEFVNRQRAAVGLPDLPFDVNAAESCPACFGHGEPYAYYHDTRHLSPDAALLYLGVDSTRNGGMKILMRDKAEAEKLYAAHIGIRPPEQPRSVNPDEMTEEDIDAVLAANGVVIEGDYATVDAAGETSSVLGAASDEEAAAAEGTRG